MRWLWPSFTVLSLFIWIRPAAAADFQEIYSRAKPSVVYVVSALPDGAASGSGFIIASDKSKSQIITANHVIEGASAVDVILDSNATRRFHATVLQHDHVRDVALLEINIGHRRALKMLPTNRVREGMPVAVVGYPRAAKAFEEIYGDDLRPSVHTGVVSAIRLGGALYQFDAVADHGDSGGPVLDTKSGSVIGIVRGAPLDQAQLAAGIEQPLPGSFYAMSAKTISSVVRGDPNDVVSGGGISGSQRSASNHFRIGFLHEQFENPVQQNIGDSLSSRIESDFKADNAYYLVPASVSVADVENGTLMGKCDDLRLNAVMGPFISWQQTGSITWIPYLGNIDSRKLNVGVNFVVLDCAGTRVYSATKAKSEGMAYAHGPEREIADMANDLIDQMEADFASFRGSHQGAWNNLLKTGIFLDPDDTTLHALWQIKKDRTNTWRVQSVFPGGPAAVAGARSGDIVDSIDGISLDTANDESLEALFSQGPFKVVLRRPEGTFTMTIIPRSYRDLMRMTGRGS